MKNETSDRSFTFHVHCMMKDDTFLPKSAGKCSVANRILSIRCCNFGERNEHHGHLGRIFRGRWWPVVLLSSSECSVLMNTIIETRENHARLTRLLGTPPFSMCTGTCCAKPGMWLRLSMMLGADKHQVSICDQWRTRKRQTFHVKILKFSQNQK